jgi:hypothetical protein
MQSISICLSHDPEYLVFLKANAVQKNLGKMATAVWSSALPIRRKIVTGESSHVLNRLRHTNISQVRGGSIGAAPIATCFGVLLSFLQLRPFFISPTSHCVAHEARSAHSPTKVTILRPLV